MGTWGIRPFDNDSATQFHDSLQPLPDRVRHAAVREMLSLTDRDDLLDSYEMVIAAAALVAVHCPGGQALDIGLGHPVGLPDTLADDLRPRAAASLTAVLDVHPDHFGWIDKTVCEQWRAGLTHLRTVVLGKPPPDQPTTRVSLTVPPPPPSVSAPHSR
ncbi:DUF4259 domain-containing protein [Streptomyces sp. GZWMJZ-114]|uniref:DUF4259 domain-containing protein n=1 Tax=Streptomyces sp. GZWMJZ-114 TaxID=2494734 RepID=UPI001010A1E5|nr:DUF4259 domain-containing protein [Streptomyces sp. GZWMJZ-114]